MTAVPFDETSQLIDKLSVASPSVPPGPLQAGFPPSIPNEPSILLTNTVQVAEFLRQELACTTIEELYPHMHYVARKSGAHIDPLHEHLLKGRTLRIAEN